VADSKRLFRSKNAGSGLVLLERAALVMLAAGGRSPGTWRELLGVVSPGAVHELDDYAWYAGADRPLPLCDEVGDLGTRANALRRNFAERGVTLLGVFVEPLPEGRFNRLVRATRNKAVVLLGLVMQLIDRVLRSASDSEVRICVDRLGGRQLYREALSTALPGHELRIMEETAERSAYRLVDRSRSCDVEFAIGGEDRHFATALASVYSKYVRESYMAVFNDYWSHHLSGLRPTAGYYTDAKRWLTDASETIDRLSIDRRVLVRDR